jgi:hypothetical protein
VKMHIVGDIDEELVGEVTGDFTRKPLEKIF